MTTPPTDGQSVTAETITDEQIRTMRRRGWSNPMRIRMALAGDVTARARCAAAWNARTGAKP